MQLLTSLAAMALPGAARGAGQRFGPAAPFSWDRLVARARTLAATRYAAPTALKDAAPDYDTAGRFAYGEADRIAGLLRLLPVSAISPMPVGIHVVEAGKEKPVTALEGLFSGGTTQPAGFRIMAPDLKSDWLSYQGASYFRASGSRHQYGLSARGIVVDAGIPDREEFPRFTDFWVERVDDTHYRIHALLDGPSLTGAFAFDSHYGADGVTQDVTATLFIRRDIERLGIAPATSMFWYGEAQRSLAVDWRPEVHDSDGLAIWAGTGERIWRPLSNPTTPTVNAFRSDHVKGFGLLQRDQRFADYQDDGAWYDRRPGLWIEPQGDWGKGAVLLYEWPSDTEIQDNIVAFWVSDQPARAGERRELRYRLRWTSDDPSDDGTARAVNLWVGTSSAVAAGRPEPGARKYVIDFQGAGLAGLGLDSGVEPVVNLTAPALAKVAAYPVLGQDGLWRVVVDVARAPADQKELRVFLRRKADTLSETVIQPLLS